MLTLNTSQEQALRRLLLGDTSPDTLRIMHNVYVQLEVRESVRASIAASAAAAPSRPRPA